MPMTAHIARARIARDLEATEQLVDQMALALARLSATMIEARLETGVQAAVGHSALMRLGKAQVAANTVKSDILRVHGELLDIAREQMGGDVHEDCPPRHASIAVPSVAA